MRQISRLLRRPYSPASWRREKIGLHTDPKATVEVARMMLNAPSARHRDERTRTADGGPCNCKVIVATIMGHGYDQHGASLHRVDLEE